MRLIAALLTALLAPASALAQGLPRPLIDRCTAEICKARLTPDQVLVEAMALIEASRFDEAQPLLAALGRVPEYRLESRFLSGRIAAAKGDHKAAIAFYRDILADDPSQTRVRLELGREMLAIGHSASADKQFRIAQQSDDLPEDIARTIRSVRDVIRSRRAWRLDVDFGLAPDTNINNATSVDTITVQWGSNQLPITLDENAKARSGVGQTATISGGFRLPVADSTSMLFDLDSSGNNYSGTDFDDYQVQLAAGPEFRFSRESSVSIQALGAQRWFGGHLASRQMGVKTGFQTRLSNTQQIGFQLDTRRTDAKFDDAYDGWQVGAYATYERAVAKSLVASAGLFARRDWLKADAYSSTELGVIAGFGGELPYGISFGLSGSASRARFDAPIPLFSPEPREDWRYTARATLGNRKIRVWGFSPQVSASYSRIDSSIPFFASDRLRFRFAVARYF
ncbi:MAG: surface lipoprotein assembly modifier [Sphingomonas sp.]|uniref:surface lipoprotein assembly modifier n=1 Tax=Sphingomonas sp. TaxID=28214 RepID=UPI0022758D15|nr:surface lipoprotein assembly modifier [Sphingomonas sp.]MCX8474828.1 surface lipoprotein assembly modifier [Sphingomonas sp.]